MKKLFVYLHGFGFDNKEHQNVINSIAKDVYDADIIAIDAPFPSNRDRGGFAWYDIDKISKEHIYDEKIELSSIFVVNEINALLQKYNLTWQDVIVCGRSQGGMIAMHIALEKLCEPNLIIALCSYYPEKLVTQENIKTKTPILWIEAKNDSVLDVEKLQSYLHLQNSGINIMHIVNSKSEHDYLDKSIVEQLLNIMQ